MEKLILKVIGIILLFVILIQASIKIFNFVNCWAGIASAFLSILITYFLLKRTKLPKQ